MEKYTGPILLGIPLVNQHTSSQIIKQNNQRLPENEAFVAVPRIKSYCARMSY